MREVTPVSDSCVMCESAEKLPGSASSRFLDTSSCSRPSQLHSSAGSSCRTIGTAATSLRSTTIISWRKQMRSRVSLSYICYKVTFTKCVAFVGCTHPNTLTHLQFVAGQVEVCQAVEAADKARQQQQVCRGQHQLLQAPKAAEEWGQGTEAVA